MSDPDPQRPAESIATQLLRLVEVVGAPLTELGRRAVVWAEENQETIQEALSGCRRIQGLGH